ncbi:sensor histidine kinase [uncultured Winogradskyella sp.]|uniref:tetratricopeptide repeat-containing sensor histidine kinase n=1 Tax=uncultured Winogradskyella sp. TaxID=395353 RepID=UPI0026209CB7|nr:sensor histidine kinase [uncultured Winogradskyella sp.]
MLFVESFCFSQNDSTYYYFDRITPNETIINKIKSSSTFIDKEYYKLIYYSKLRDKDSISKYIKSVESIKNLSETRLAKFSYFKAYYHRISQNDSLSFIYHNEALKIGEKIQDTLTILAALSGLSQSTNYIDKKPYRLDYIEQLRSQAEKFNNIKFKISASFLRGNYYLFRDNDSMALKKYKETLKFRFTKRDSTILLRTLSNIGVMYSEDLNMPDSALFYYNKRYNIIINNKAFQSSNNYFNSFINLGTAYNYKSELDKALFFTLKADSVPIVENILSRKAIVKQNLADIYAKLGNYKKAYHNFSEYYKLSDSIKSEKHREAIASLDFEKVRAEKAESDKRSFVSESKRKQNENIAIGLGGSLALGSVIAFLIFKNTKRKQKLAEQEKEIESQKLATVLKEQELTAIDAMIEGQEKERQRIANDLHDDLGGLMANVKLHFNALKDKDSPELFDKTNNLIEEAYQKVRSVAHAKNSGVIAKQGLLKAVRNMADKVSTSNKIQIDVLDHGLDNRLENSLELTLFRVIQELITNVIKHAQATETTIHLTNHEDSINIMVEDNGKGFNPSQITKINKGMGISSIDKRVEHLDGKLTIESDKNKGTTVIIDIPL